MHRRKRANDSVHWYMSELSARVVAESGRPSDRFHLGKLILQGLKDAPDFIHQIDGSTKESETNASVLERSVRCASALKSFGLKCGDVIVMMAPNHLDLAIPFYAALYLGAVIAPVDRTLTVKELFDSFNVTRPKMIFCQSEKASDIQLTLNQLDLNAEIITFDKGDYLCNFQQFLDKHADNTPVEEFRPENFDPDETLAMLIPTSGTTGTPKSASVSHKNFAITNPYIWSRWSKFPTPILSILIAAPLQWLTSLVHYLVSPIMRYTRIQSSLNLTPDHACYLIKNFKPKFAILSPTLMTTLIRTKREQCDLSCFETILLGGSAVPQDLIEEIKKISPETEVCNVYGMTELTCLGFHTNDPPPGSCGQPLGCFQYRLIHGDTKNDVTDPFVPGELWMKGPGIFKGYYNNDEATADTFSEDWWFKTGDIFYRDDSWNFYFVERAKLLLKYKSYQISTVELESVIRQHPGVLDVAVTGIPDPECGDLPVACVVRHSGSNVTAQDIKDIVKNNLSDAKQLRGGVIFLKELPMTASTKIHRRKLKEMASQLERE